MNNNTILVVDDSAVMRQMNRAVLEAGGYRVLLAEDGDSALALLRQEPVALVLTDWTMAPMDGGEFTRQLRQLPYGLRLPLLVLSTISSGDAKDQARAAGANGWLCKPIEPETLLAVIASLMTESAA